MTEQERMEKMQELRVLIDSITSPDSPIGDYKIIKYCEYTAVGEDSGVDISQLHKDRDTVRTQIRKLKEELGL